MTREGEDNKNNSLCSSFSSDLPPLSLWGHSTVFICFCFLKWLLFTQNHGVNEKTVISTKNQRLEPHFLGARRICVLILFLLFPGLARGPSLIDPGPHICKKQELGSMLSSLLALPHYYHHSTSLLGGWRKATGLRQPPCNGEESPGPKKSKRGCNTGTELRNRVLPLNCLEWDDFSLRLPLINSSVQGSGVMNLPESWVAPAPSIHSADNIS